MIREKIHARLTITYSVVLICLLTLNPFQFRWPAEGNFFATKPLEDWLLVDAMQNVLLFLPLGMALAWFWKWPLLRISLIGAGLSFAVEMAQLFIDIRTTSDLDTVFNTIGVALGAALIYFAPKSLGQARFSFALMLMPYCWIVAIVAALTGKTLEVSMFFTGLCALLSLPYEKPHFHEAVFSFICFTIASGGLIATNPAMALIVFGAAIVIGILQRLFPVSTISAIFPIYIAISIASSILLWVEKGAELGPRGFSLLVIQIVLTIFFLIPYWLLREEEKAHWHADLSVNPDLVD